VGTTVDSPTVRPHQHAVGVQKGRNLRTRTIGPLTVARRPDYEGAATTDGRCRPLALSSPLTQAGETQDFELV
jgi:hypothetical protein